ncbi:MAG TPA: hypothetical protein VJU14_01555 [Solirubrobacterales bacterium]|nr:hypothetical protein [Solirubrobacterales bacterium]
MRRLLLVSLLALSLALGACGGESNEEKAIEAIEVEDRVIEAINRALVSTDPDACTEQMTQAFNEQKFREGGDAVESCEQNARAEESPNPPVEVIWVEIEGAEATAAIDTRNTQPLVVALLEEDGNWKLDEFVRFLEFDRGMWLKEERASFENAGEYALEPPVVDCILGAYREMSRAEIEEMVLGGSGQVETEIWEGCGA